MRVYLPKIWEVDPKCSDPLKFDNLQMEKLKE
jgi:hypothetical protein